MGYFCPEGHWVSEDLMEYGCVLCNLDEYFEDDDDQG